MKQAVLGLMLAAGVLLPMVSGPRIAHADEPLTVRPLPTKINQNLPNYFPTPSDTGTVDYGNCVCTPAPQKAALPTTVLAQLPISLPDLSRATSNCTVSATDAAVDGEESQLLSLLNAYRAQNGLAALSSFAILNQSSAWLSADSIKRGFTPSDHIDSLGRWIPQRVQDCGFKNYREIRENDYQGYGDASATGAQGAFNWWKGSPEHNAAMLASDVTLVGVGRACSGNVCSWTLDLGNK
jgi:uncharacterized protein YkwD